MVVFIMENIKQEDSNICVNLDGEVIADDKDLSKFCEELAKYLNREVPDNGQIETIGR